jgi:hypothetical protein
MEQKKGGGEAVNNYPHPCVFVEGIETKVGFKKSASKGE